MPKKIALDYDESELRIVVAQCSGARVSVTDAQVLPIGENDSASEVLRRYVTENQLQKLETFITIGRGKAELRELQLPPVPEEELPDMVRFQAVRSFASASDRAIVDFLVTERSDEAITLIAAAVSPNDLKSVEEVCTASELVTKRVALRPLASTSLYLQQGEPKAVSVLIDLLADDAEIVVARDGKVIFVRTVRLPSSGPNRSKAIAGELRRTMAACGEVQAPDQIVVWGSQAVHSADLEAIRDTVGCDDVRAVDPFDLVNLQVDRQSLPEHVGRLAPLVGLLSIDESAPEMLIDFLNPRERPVEEPDRVRRILMVALPVAAVFLVGFFIYRQFAALDRQIASANDEVNKMLPLAEAADESIARTEKIDQFLDSDVNWLDELRRFADKAPPSDKLIVKSIFGTASVTTGGGRLRISGAVTEPGVIDEMEESLRDGTHSVIGSGSEEQKTEDAYRWNFTETIVINGGDLRALRYERMADAEQAVDEQAVDEQAVDEQAAEEPAPETPASEEQVASEPTASEPTASEPTASEQTASELAADEPTGAESGETSETSAAARPGETTQPRSEPDQSSESAAEENETTDAATDPSATDGTPREVEQAVPASQPEATEDTAS
jgi:hypothetical protein